MEDGQFLIRQIPIAVEVAPLSVVEARCCSNINVEDSGENGKSGIIEKASNGDVLESTFDSDEDEIFLGYPSYAEHTRRLHL